MSPVVVRAAEPTDLEAIHALFRCPGVIAQTLQMPFQSLQSRQDRFFSAAAPDHQLVAEVEGVVVGFLGLSVQKRPRLRHTAGFGVAVHDDFQNRGAGRALMAAMIDLADNWIGIHRLALEVYADNHAAIHLYEAFGFLTEGRMRDYSLREGRYVDALLMARIRS